MLETWVQEGLSWDDPETREHAAKRGQCPPAYSEHLVVMDAVVVAMMVVEVTVIAVVTAALGSLIQFTTALLPSTGKWCPSPWQSQLYQK